MAHIRSILPQRGGVSPVDNNTAALFHYDEHVNDNLKGLRAIGNRTALSFDGTTTRVQLASTSMFNTNIVTTFGNQMSIDLWVWLDELPSEQPITYRGIFDAGADAFVIYLQNNGELRFKVTANTTVWVATPQANFSKQTWFHVACTYDGVNATTYINGVQTATQPVTGNITSFTPYIGWDGGSAYFKGRLSNFRIWNKGLTADEVIQAKNNVLADDSKVAHWKLDESSGTIVYDYSKNGNDGLISGTINWKEGLSIYSLKSGGYPGGTGKGVLIEEATTNELNGPDWSAYSGYSLLSTSVIDEPESFTGNAMYMKDVDSSMNSAARVTLTAPSSIQTGNHTFSVYAKGAGSAIGKKPRLYTGVSWYAYGGPETLTDSYQQFVFPNLTYNSSTAGPAIGINGWAVGDELYLHSPQLEQKAYNTSFVVGSRSNMHLWYPTPGSGATQFTVSLWIKLSNAVSNAVHILSITDPTANNVNSVHIDTAGTSNAYRAFTYDVNSSATVAASTTVPVAGQWTYLAVVKDATNLSFYINGVLSAQQVNGGNVTLNGIMALGERIGSGSYNGRYANVEIDELRIDTVARTSTEISSWYYQERNGW